MQSTEDEDRVIYTTWLFKSAIDNVDEFVDICTINRVAGSVSFDDALRKTIPDNEWEHAKILLQKLKDKG